MGDLEDSSATLTGVRDAVGLLGADDELVSGPRVDDLVADLDFQAFVEDDPQLVAELVVVLGRLLAGLDRLRDLPVVGDVRGLGMMCGVELVTDSTDDPP